MQAGPCGDACAAVAHLGITKPCKEDWDWREWMRVREDESMWIYIQTLFRTSSPLVLLH